MAENLAFFFYPQTGRLGFDPPNIRDEFWVQFGFLQISGGSRNTCDGE